ncbi:hypothetical protein N9X24_00445, partial [Rickettsiales bacterium]|nr:hypothetical protein [Rickettsiales bacterium]
MQISKKKRLDIEGILLEIQKNSFEENLIKSFLITIRENISNSLLREVCDFVAHSERDRGCCSEEINKKYFQLKYANLPPHNPVPFNIHEINKKEFE